MQIEIGKIINTHGIKGELKIISSTDFEEERFAVGKRVNIQFGKDLIPMEVASFRRHKGCLLVAFKDLLNINFVEKYKGCVISVDSEGLQELDEDEVYFYQLVDCKVIDEEHNELGSVVEIIETSAHDILRIRNDEGKEVLIPYVDAFIVDVDVDEKMITVHLIEGFV